MPSASSLSPGSPSSAFKLNILPNKFRKSPSPPPPASLGAGPEPTTPFGSAPAAESSFASYRPGGGNMSSATGGSSSSTATATTTTTTTRLRSSSQPMRPTSSRSAVGLPPQLSRHQSHLNFRDALSSSSSSSAALSATVVPVRTEAAAAASDKKKVKGRGRSASLVTVTQVGGEEMDGADMGTLGTQNWDWLDSKGAVLQSPLLCS